MRVLHIFLDESLEAAKRGLVNLCLAGVKSGAFTPLIACLENSPLANPLEEAGVTVLPLSGTGTWRPGVWGRLKKARRIHDFSVVHTHDSLSARLGAKCRQAWPEMRWVHTCWTPLAPNRARELEKLRVADMLATLNGEGLRRLEAAGFAADILRSIPMGIDPANCPQLRDDDPERLKIPALGPLMTDSGHAVLLEALALFKTAHPQLTWELRLAGEGPLFEQILRQAGASGIGEHMAFLGPQRPCDVLPHCDMLIAPDLRGENGCEAIKWAWAAGLPVICSDLPVHAEMVTDGENGRMAPRESAAALAEALDALRGDPDLQRKLTQGGRASLESYTLEGMVENYARVYENLVTAANAGTAQNGQGV